jgi:predicted amino acid dehydrogenase
MRVSTEEIAYRTGVNLPIIIDFQGQLARGISLDLDLDRLILLTDLVAAERISVSVQFCFGRNFAYMSLDGHVTSVIEEESESGNRFRIEIQFSHLSEPERSILQSCLYEFLLDAVRATRYGENSQIESDPLAILSLFVTDNPYPLLYRRTQSDRRALDSRPPAALLGEQERRMDHLQRPSPPPFSWRTVLQGLGLALQLVRDLLVRLLPRSMARFLVRDIAFAFIGHPRDLTDVPRKFPFARFLPARAIEYWFRHQWPFIASYITGLKTKDGRAVTGAMLISPPTTLQMLQNPRLAKKRVYQTAKLAEKMGAQLAGLGAFTSIVTKDGKDLLGKVNIGITTGNPHSAAIAVQNILLASILTNLSLPSSTVAIVGGAGSVGSACAKLLARLVSRLILVDIKREELKKVLQSLDGQPCLLEGTAGIESIKKADVIIVATNNPHILISAEHLKPGAIVVDAAQPKNVSEKIPLQRPDVLVIESAIVQTPSGVNCNFDLGLGAGEALGCLSETMILTAVGRQGHYSLGKAEPQQAAETLAEGRSLGFRLAYFRNSLGYLTEEDLLRSAKARTIMTTHV